MGFLHEIKRQENPVLRYKNPLAVVKVTKF